jgi:hypothetical protein
MPYRAASANLHLDKYYLVATRVDDVVFHALQPGVTAPGVQLRFPVALRRLEEKLTVRLRYHDIIMPMNMPAGLGAKCESPLGDDHAVIEYLLRGNCLRTIHENFLSEVSDDVRRVAGRVASIGALSPVGGAPPCVDMLSGSIHLQYIDNHFEGEVFRLTCTVLLLLPTQLHLQLEIFAANAVS